MSRSRVNDDLLLTTSVSCTPLGGSHFDLLSPRVRPVAPLVVCEGNLLLAWEGGEESRPICLTVCTAI